MGVLKTSMHFPQMLQDNGSWSKLHPGVTRGALQIDAWVLPPQIVMTLVWGVAWVLGVLNLPKQI